MPWKHVACPLFSCSMKTVVNSLHCFFVVFVSVRALNSPSVFTQLLMVNVKKTWCSSIIFLLHGNANEQFVFLNAMKTTCSSIVIIISCSWSCLMKTSVNSLFNIQSIDNDWAVWVIWGSWALASELDINIRWKSPRGLGKIGPLS